MSVNISSQRRMIGLMLFLAASALAWVAVPGKVEAQPGCQGGSWDGKYFPEVYYCDPDFPASDCSGILIVCPPPV